ncbi:MAG TPA: hypothetical protein VMR50_02355 [Myxococcota bacterium]|nr:hypothetical protein [Myxococcota bacterium]
MRARSHWLALALCAALASCQREDPVPGLEAERAQLLATTVPRDEYWKEVERKGVALKAQRAAEQRSQQAETERSQIVTVQQQLQTAVNDAKNVNEQIVKQRDGLIAQTEKQRARQRELESFLARTGPPDVAAPPK